MDPKDQAEALLAKLLVHGLSPRNEPWKDLLQRRATMTQPQCKTFFNMPQDLNWLFSTIKLHKTKFYFWNSLMGAWRNVRSDLVKAKPMVLDEILHQSLFGTYIFHF